MLPFTPRLIRAIACAEARQPHDVSCLDLLFGIMSLEGGVSVNILKSRGFPTSNLMSASEDVKTASGPMQYRSCGLISLSQAINEASNSNHQIVGVEHLLAGILTSSCPEIKDLFTEKDINLDETLSELRNNM
jgi:ATP-dependent Clp protease ATP-binding subunit ClpA